MQHPLHMKGRRATKRNGNNRKVPRVLKNLKCTIMWGEQIQWKQGNRRLPNGSDFLKYEGVRGEEKRRLVKELLLMGHPRPMKPQKLYFRQSVVLDMCQMQICPNTCSTRQIACPI